ncbi:sensor histidine kinase [Alsobacter ponti]|uniref:sensor histidine kinase n=1 Tax=Alsobacter ponti TaxID=2962936 RepID=UPI003530DE82
MPLPRSIQGRLALGLCLGLALLWIAASVAALEALRRRMDEVFDSALQETAQRILPLAVMEIIDRGEGGAQRVASAEPHRERVAYVVRDEAGRTVLQSHDADAADFPDHPPLGFSSTHAARYYAETALQGSLTIVMAEPLEGRRHAVAQAARALAMPLLLVLVPLGFVGAWLLVRASMAPVRGLCAEIETRGGGDLRPLGADGLPTEIEPIAAAIDQLMERLRRALDAERNFAARSAHELRTPIAAALAQTQRLLAETHDDATRERALQVEDTMRRLARLAEKLMQLARAEGGRLLTEQPADCVPVLRVIADDLRRSTGLGDRLMLELPDAPVLTRLDPDALSILVRNLVENGARHGAPDEPVRVSLASDGVLRVVSAGPVVPADRLASLTKPFERGPTSARGSGLGLAIADAIARGARARLTLHSPATDRPDGFEARVSLAEPGPAGAAPTRRR